MTVVYQRAACGAVDDERRVHGATRVGRPWAASEHWTGRKPRPRSSKGGTTIKSLYLLAHGIPRFFGVFNMYRENYEKGRRGRVL
jgi:hypothetical protein